MANCTGANWSKAEADRQTHDFDLAANWAKELFDSPNFFDFWFPREHFLNANAGLESEKPWMSALRSDRNGRKHAIALGSGAKIDPQWDSFSISRFADLTNLDRSRYNEGGHWDGYFIKTEHYQNLAPLENLLDQSDGGVKEINEFLETHFPNASTKAPDPEVQSWCALRNESSELIALGALSKWESGNLAAQSIAVASSTRGKGIGKEFVKRMVATAAHLGFKDLCLGVNHYNESAKKVYESVGFNLIDQFIYFEKLGLKKVK
jgi:ribosomal protein S18 acetylase RimI-like enzyme